MRLQKSYLSLFFSQLRSNWIFFPPSNNGNHLGHFFQQPNILFASLSLSLSISLYVSISISFSLSLTHSISLKPIKVSIFRFSNYKSSYDYRIGNFVDVLLNNDNEYIDGSHQICWNLYYNVDARVIIFHWTWNYNEKNTGCEGYCRVFFSIYIIYIISGRFNFYLITLKLSANVD